MQDHGVAYTTVLSSYVSTVGEEKLHSARRLCKHERGAALQVQPVMSKAINQSRLLVLLCKLQVRR